MPERLLGTHPWRTASIFIIALSLIVILLTALLIDQRGEVQGLKAREEERERSAAVAKTVQCFQAIQDAPNGLALLELIDRSARNRIVTNQQALKRDPDPGGRDVVRRKAIRDDWKARQALQVLRDRYLANVSPLEPCERKARELGLDPVGLGFNLRQLHRISRDLQKQKIGT